jgi:aryl-alcohol dehydrogenase-like predicted oxidoreductase
VKKLQKLANEIKVSLAQLSIAWCINNPHVTTAILGATNKKQLLENLKAIEIIPKLDNEILNKIEKIVNTKPVLPDY